jgi:DNA polymerase elongation subunit (family B)
MNDVIFQILDWNWCHEEKDDGRKQYTIQLFGRTKEDNKTVYVKIDKYTPYFFVELPAKWKSHTTKIFIDEIKKKVWPEGNVEGLKGFAEVEKCRFWGFTNYSKFKYIQLVFNDYDSMKAYEKVFNKKIYIKSIAPKGVKYKVYESNIEPLIRCMHIRNLDAVGFVKINGNKYKNITDAMAGPSCCDINISTDWTSLDRVDSEDILPFVIASFDIECTSCDGCFPQADRITDRVIQIGTTFSRVGESECYYQHIITLDTCDPIEGADVESYKTEQEVLLAWTSLIKRTNPDILTGFNIFGFDFEYLKNRSKKLNIYNKFSKLSRINDEVCEFKEQKLASSALGENILKYYQTRGRVLMDLMKVIMRDHKLPSYKLDYVAAYFIKELIVYIEYIEHPGVAVYNPETGKIEVLNPPNKTMIITKGVDGVKVGQYITILYNDGITDSKHMDGEKFQILEIGEIVKTEFDNKKKENVEIKYKTLIVSGIIDSEILKYKYKVYWCQSKDDVSPKEIFDLQTKTSADRARIAKYCIAEGTHIMLDNMSYPIEKLNNTNMNIYSYNEDKKGIEISKQNKFFNNGVQPCIELMFEDETTITCTEDHKILVSDNNWIEARNLIVGETRIKKSITLPLSNMDNDLITYGNWSHGTFNFTNEYNYRRSLAYSRLIGLILTDGTVTKWHIGIFVGHLLDVESVVNDIKLILIDKTQKITVKKSLHTYDISVPIEIRHYLMKITGLKIGGRMNQDSYLPEFISDPNCPLPIIREFLGGLFGGDGDCPSLNISGNKFTNLGFGQSKNKIKEDNLRDYLNNISILLQKFGINAMVHNPRNIKTSKDEEHISMKFIIPMDKIPLFEKEIGFRYCVHKQLRLSIVSSYYKAKNKIISQSNWITTRVNELKEGQHISKLIMQTAYNELKNMEPIFNDHYSLPNMRTTSGRLHSNKLTINEMPMNHLYFKSPIDYLKTIGAYKCFVSENNKTYAVDIDNMVIPTYNLKLIGKKNVGNKQVYDMEIDKNHSYLANGFVVHNCIMDCALCNKIISKLLIIPNNISMAKVCHVPLSYLFLRGQGVKIFSLVSRKCREKNHLIPVIRKKKIKDLNPEMTEKEKQKEKDAHAFENFVNCLIERDKGCDGDEDDEEEDDGYEGATVFPPIKGVHFEPIPVLDFASLYPNAMIFRNLSHETFVNDPEYDNIQGYIYHQITYMTTKIVEDLNYFESIKRKGDLIKTYTDLKCTYQDSEKMHDNILHKLTRIFDSANILVAELIITKKTFRLYKYETSRFAEKTDGTKGIIPEILNELLSSRKYYKKLMEAETDPFKRAIFDCMQLALKITANSVYGQTGGPTSPLYLKAIAASTTATGREMLQFAKHFVEEDFTQLIKLVLFGKKNQFLEKARQIYMYHVHKIITKEHGEVHVHSCENAIIPDKKFIVEDSDVKGKMLFSTKEEFFEKFYVSIKEILTGCDINPEIIYGDSVVPDTPIMLRTQKDGKYFIEIKTIETIGSNWKSYNQFKIGQDGLSDKQQDDSTMNNYEVWTDKGWSKIKRIIRHKTNKDIYEVLTHTGYVRVTEDHSLLTSEGKQIKPNECAIGTELLHSFPNNESKNYENYEKIINDYFANNGTFIDNGYTVHIITINNQLEAMKLYYMLRNNNYNVIIDIVHDKDLFILNCTKKPYSENLNKIKLIKRVDNQYDYVYDLETEVGHFHAGVGQMIVKNTDSIFFNLHLKDVITGESIMSKEGLKKAIEIGIWSSICLCIMLPLNMQIVYEKTLWPFAILTKKRYVGNLYETNPDKYYQKSMGIVLKRRDNAPIVKIVCGGIINEILNKRSAQGSVDFTRRILKQILSEKFPIDKFIITKTLKDKYADRTRMVHAVLADRMAERDPGNKPQSNDRIPYAYVELDKEKRRLLKKKELLQGNRVEHPDYIISKNLKLDYLFYITNQIMIPAIQFLELIVEDPKKIFEDYINRENNRQEGKKPINFYFNQKNDNDDNYDDESDEVAIVNDEPEYAFEDDGGDGGDDDGYDDDNDSDVEEECEEDICNEIIVESKSKKSNKINKISLDDDDIIYESKKSATKKSLKPNKPKKNIYPDNNIIIYDEENEGFVLD